MAESNRILGSNTGLGGARWSRFTCKVVTPSLSVTVYSVGYPWSSQSNGNGHERVPTAATTSFMLSALLLLD